MNKKSIQSIIATALVLIIFIFSILFFFLIRDGVNPISYVFHRSQVEITASTQIYLADISENNAGNYYNYYNSYDKKDEYDLYVVPIKVVNNSDFILTNLKLNNNKKADFIIDFYSDNYFLDHECSFSVYPKSTGYVAGLISIKKGTQESKIKSIVNQIDNNVILEMGVKTDTAEGNIIVPKYKLKKKFDITDVLFNESDVETHYENIF